jgi:hypothetical protein
MMDNVERERLLEEVAKAIRDGQGLPAYQKVLIRLATEGGMTPDDIDAAIRKRLTLREVTPSWLDRLGVWWREHRTLVLAAAAGLVLIAVVVLIRPIWQQLPIFNARPTPTAMPPTAVPPTAVPPTAVPVIIELLQTSAPFSPTLSLDAGVNTPLTVTVRVREQVAGGPARQVSLTLSISPTTRAEIRQAQGTTNNDGLLAIGLTGKEAGDCDLGVSAANASQAIEATVRVRPVAVVQRGPPPNVRSAPTTLDKDKLRGGKLSERFLILGKLRNSEGTWYLTQPAAPQPRDTPQVWVFIYDTKSPERSNWTIEGDVSQVAGVDAQGQPVNGTATPAPGPTPAQTSAPPPATTIYPALGPSKLQGTGLVPIYAESEGGTPPVLVNLLSGTEVEVLASDKRLDMPLQPGFVLVKVVFWVSPEYVKPGTQGSYNLTNPSNKAQRACGSAIEQGGQVKVDACGTLQPFFGTYLLDLGTAAPKAIGDWTEAPVWAWVKRENLP